MRVAVLKGGRSLERPVSLRSGAQVEDALERLGHEALPVDVRADLVERLEAERAEVAFIALHGRDGEDGALQELLEAIELPYTGSGPGACARCIDKALAKHELRAAGMPTPDFFAFKEAAIEELGVAAALPRIERALGFPLVVKPASQGSALGIKFAHSDAELPAAIVGALAYDRKVLLERHIKGRDLAVAVLAPSSRSLDARQAPPIALPIVEAIPRGEEFYSYDSRYEIGAAQLVCPAELPVPVTARAQELALRCFDLFGCHGYARVDMMLQDGSDALEILEVNVVPGLTETSLLPLAADAAGISFDELIERILASAFSRRSAGALRAAPLTPAG
ncbi:MAG TPA: D-alanine--D-alanine ligase [Solirubrobacteraceae bacterium]|nr:D-alanine--D-alanine ligase [Solirubrobacteraceae bacterium]